MVQYHFVKAWLTAQAKTERGASLVEYALLVALIGVVVLAAMSFLGARTNAKFSQVGTSLA